MALSENLEGKTNLPYRVLDAVGGVLDISERFARTIGNVLKDPLKDPVTFEFGRRALAKDLASDLANGLAGGINGVNHRLHSVNQMLFGARPE